MAVTPNALASKQEAMRSRVTHKKATSTPRPRVANFNSRVPGKIVELDPTLEFNGSGRKSPYRDDLLELKRYIEDNPGKHPGLEYENKRCIYAIRKQAQKLGLNVLFTECDGKLFVMIDGLAIHKTITKALDPKPLTFSDLHSAVLKAGHNIDVDSLKVELQTLSKNQVVTLDSFQSGSVTEKKWRLIRKHQ